jgi:hypothetical protein
MDMYPGRTAYCWDGLYDAPVKLFSWCPGLQLTKVSIFANMAIINYPIEYFHPRVKAEIETWPKGILADFARMVELLMEFGPDLRMPRSRAMGSGIFSI